MKTNTLLQIAIFPGGVGLSAGQRVCSRGDEKLFALRAP